MSCSTRAGTTRRRRKPIPTPEATSLSPEASVRAAAPGGGTEPAASAALAERVASAVAGQRELFAVLRSSPLQPGDEPAIAFRP
jgi:hypothetical protein